MAPDRAALDRRKAALPRIRDLADAEARLDWVNPRPELPVRMPGVSRQALLRVREWPAPPEGRRCIGRLGAAPVRDPDEDARAVAALLGEDAGQRRLLESGQVISALRARLRRSRELLCEPAEREVAHIGVPRRGQVAACNAESGGRPHSTIRTISCGALPCGLKGVPASVPQAMRTPARALRRNDSSAHSAICRPFSTA